LIKLETAASALAREELGMAKRRTKVIPARKEETAAHDDDSLLVRSAESLGRVIGSLQRQVRGSSKRAASIADDVLDALPDLPRFDTVFGGEPRARKRTAARKASARKTKTARKTAGARKAAGSRGRAGSRKAPSKKR
jgi:hypothetical protein